MSIEIYFLDWGQAQKCGGIKTDKVITTPLLIIETPLVIQI
jgi:hypothetical protein